MTVAYAPSSLLSLLLRLLLLLLFLLLLLLLVLLVLVLLFVPARVVLSNATDRAVTSSCL